MTSWLVSILQISKLFSEQLARTSYFIRICSVAEIHYSLFSAWFFFFSTLDRVLGCIPVHIQHSIFYWMINQIPRCRVPEFWMYASNIWSYTYGNVQLCLFQWLCIYMTIIHLFKCIISYMWEYSNKCIWCTYLICSWKIIQINNSLLFNLTVFIYIMYFLIYIIVFYF